MNQQDGLQLKMTHSLGTRLDPLIPAGPVLPDLASVALALAAVASLLLALWLRAQARRRHAGTVAVQRTVPAPAPLPAAAPAQAAPMAMASSSRKTASATLPDLHELREQLDQRPNPIARKGLLEDHLERFAHTSPWVLLELRAVRGHRYHLWAEEEGPEFAGRFGVRPPSEREWARKDRGILADPQLCDELTASWPHDAKAVITFWLLGSRAGSRPQRGMPLLPLATYRELLFLDSLRVAREFDHPSEFAPLH